MVPGGATPQGALGYVSAALEVAAQVAAGALPAPRQIVVGVGSTCTSAGLLAGTDLAVRLGLLERAPRIIGIRVTPWPVTAAYRISRLAARVSALVAELTGDGRLSAPRAALAPRLSVIGGHIGRGYGFVTPGGRAAIARFAAAGGPPLDTCYSGKAAAGLLTLPLDGPTLFWATKSSRPLPPVAPGAPAPPLPRAMVRWLARPILGAID
jgi:D-cysteine desulfhydrase